MSSAMQRALDALFDDKPLPEEAPGALSPEERAEIASLAATAVLARRVLHAPQPSREAEESSLRRAERHLGAQRPSRSAAPGPGFLLRLMRRWRGKG